MNEEPVEYAYEDQAFNNDKCASNMMQNMYDMQDMICDAYACSGRKMMNMAVTWQTKNATGNMR